VNDANEFAEWQADEGWDGSPEADWKPDTAPRGGKYDGDMRRELQKVLFLSQSPNKNISTHTTNPLMRQVNLEKAFGTIDTVFRLTFPRPQIVENSKYFEDHPRSRGYCQSESVAINPQYYGSVQERATLYHEWVHYLWLKNVVRNDINENLLGELFGTLIKDTSAYKKLKSTTRDQKYWLSSEELQARLIAQFIAEVGNDNEVAGLLESQFPQQWKKEEFLQLKPMLEKIFQMANLYPR
jgi:hypothetical protein